MMRVWWGLLVVLGGKKEHVPMLFLLKHYNLCCRVQVLINETSWQGKDVELVQIDGQQKRGKFVSWMVSHNNPISVEAVEQPRRSQ